MEDMTWTLQMDISHKVTAKALAADGLTFGYVIDEADRIGKLDMVRVEALKIDPGENLSRLKSGESIVNTYVSSMAPCLPA